MKVLIISHNPMNLEENNGRTIRNLFSGFNKGDVAQLFLHSGNVDAPFCQDYYRITDFDIFDSLIRRSNPGSIVYSNTDNKTSKTEKTIYGTFSRKTKYIRFIRDSAWSFGTWKTDRLKQWLITFNPDVIFFYASDSFFSHSLARWVRDYLQVPMVIYWVDDYYIKLKGKGTIIDRINQKRFKKISKKNNEESFVICITPKMARDYEKIFNKKCYVLLNTTINKPYGDKEHGLPLVLSYLGNISIGRYNSIISIGKVINDNNLPIVFNVYSGEYRQRILKQIANKPGFNYYGKVDYDQVKTIMESSDLLLHVEDFQNKNIEFCRYSLSTKIADSLISNRCLLCYGPKEIACIEYLKEEDCALIATNLEELENALKSICNNPLEMNAIAQKAKSVAEKNHSVQANSELIKQYLSEAINDEASKKHWKKSE